MRMTEEQLDGRYVELSDRAIFRITGPDRIRYLNGQVSNDVAGPIDERAIAACLCSLKGKVEFLVWISAVDDVLYLDGQLDQREALYARLDRYLIADDCEIEDVTDQMTLFHHFGSDAGGIKSRRLTIEGWDHIVESESAGMDNLKEMGLDEFQRQQALSLIPASPWEITGNEFPAELGIDSWAVDFHKGCYLGQEVISRIKSVGKVKHSLILVSAETKLAQDSIVRTNDKSEGRVTRVIEGVEEKNHLAICFLKRSPQEGGALVPQRVEPVSEF